MKILATLLLLLVAATLSACGCGSNEEAVAVAQSLSKPRLEKLAQDLNALSVDSPGRTFDQGRIPLAFADLSPVAVVADPILPRVHFSGCADDKVLIALRAFGDEKYELVLLKGERQGEAVLWQSE